MPTLVHLVSSPLAGALFDRMGIMPFRAINTTIWGASYALLFLGLLLANWPLVLVGFAMRGLASATGAVVWNIGHTRFAGAHRSQLYMGVHMTLTGIRGATMPFLGLLLYRGLSWPAIGLEWCGLGLSTMAIGCGVIFATGIVFACIPSPALPSED